MGQTAITNAGLDYVAATDNWLLTLVLPLAQPLLERRAVLVGRIDLSRLRRFLTERPAAAGTVTAVDAGSGRLFDPMRLDLSANGEY